ncbi:phage tail tape measure protein [Pseudomonas mohnii]|uniref:phage tail tape measure protein n=1 Tax=Pseudomonas mohnii TaxID=395600 RepID=UPI0018DE64F1|nr:phage tail tape measure protein [Pseudomonas mohnii]MBH8611219.1 phage tail tape measure protein [Pseudomonas mohnii]
MDIASLGIKIDTSDAAKAVTDLDKVVQSGEKAERAAEDISAGFDKASVSASDLSASERKLSETLDEAKARLLATAKASLESSEYYQRLTTSVNTNVSAMESSGSSVSSLAALQRRLQAESDALVGSTDRQAEAARGAAAATGVQAEGLQALLAKINPTVAAYEKLDQQQELLKRHLKAGNIDSDQFKAYSADIEKTRSKLGDFDEGLRKTGVSAGQTQAALRQLPAQFTDIFTSLAGGQNPLMVLIQQGGQIKDSFGGIGPTMDALKDKFRSLFSGGAGAAVLGESLAGIASGAKDTAENAGEASESLSDLAESSNTAAEAAESAKKAYGALPPAVTGASMSILGMVATVAAVAAVIGTLIYGYSKGSQEADEYNKSLILTGNYAGTTADGLASLAKQVSSTVGTTGAASAVLAQLAGSGNIAAYSFEEITKAVLTMEEATGKAVGETVAQFASIAKEPVAASIKLNEQYHYLTASVYEQIVALEKQGEQAASVRLATDAFADAIQSRGDQITQRLGTIEKAWSNVAKAAKWAWDSALDIGREATYEEKLADLEKQAQNAARLGAGPRGGGGRSAAQIESDRTSLMLEEQERRNRAQAKQQDQQRQEAAVSGMQLIAREADSAQTQVQKLEKKLIDLDKARQKNIANNTYSPDLQKQYESAVAGVNKQIVDANKKAAGPAGALNLTEFNDSKNQLSLILGEYKNAQKELEAAQKAGLVTQEDYLLKSQALIGNERDQVTAAYEAEIAALEAAKGKKTTSAAQSIQLDQKIADARAGMVKAQKDADSQLEVLAIAEKGRIDKQTLNIQRYIDALGEQQKALVLAGQRAVVGVGQGDRQNALSGELNGQQDSYAKQVRELESQQSDPSRKMDPEEFNRKSQALADANKKATDQIRQNYADVEAAQGDWTKGATAAWDNYLDSARNIAGQTKSLFGNAFSSMEDSLVNFAITGKASFADFTKSILADMARIATRQASSSLLGSLVGAATSYFTGSGSGSGTGNGLAAGSAGAVSSNLGASQAGYTGIDFSGYRAAGGPVAPNSLYEVNELGPELYNEGGRSFLMTGANGGSVTPLTTGGGPALAAMSGGGGNTYNFPVAVSVQTSGSEGGGVSQEASSQLGKSIQQAAKTEAETAIARALQPGGSIWRLINGRA